LDEGVKDLGDIVELFKLVYAIKRYASELYLSEVKEVLRGNIPEVFSEAPGGI
jgi:hypothetical protein